MNLEKENSFEFSSYFHFSIFSFRKLSEHSDKYVKNADANNVFNSKFFRLADNSFTYETHTSIVIIQLEFLFVRSNVCAQEY